MKTVSPAMLALLASRQFYLVDLYEFTLADGTVARYAASADDIYTNSDITLAGDVTAIYDVVVYGTETWSSGGVEAGPYFERAGENSKIMLRAGLQVSTFEFTVYPGTATISGIGWKRAALIGLFDGATLKLYRAIMPNFGDASAGAVLVFSGRVGNVFASRAEGLRFAVNSHVELLNQTMPRNLYRSGCIWTLYDAGCAINEGNFSQTGASASGSTKTVINCSLPQATGYFDLGKVRFLSGPNAGFTVGVRKYTQGSPGAMTLLQPLPNTPTVGNSFVAYAGCDKRQDTCEVKFNNLRNFRGYPYIPIPETAV